MTFTHSNTPLADAHTAQAPLKIYFKNLDGIRFFAALFVLLQHSFGFKKGYADAPPFLERCFAHAGVIGVNLFFLLSGFLISYLLLVERDRTGTVQYRHFYLRRILRIWPLYLGYGLLLAFASPYLSGALGLGNDVTLGKTLLNIVFLLLFSVNFQLAFLGANKGTFDISWSVCIEEQFYLMWPLFINNFRKKLLTLVGVMVAIAWVSRLFICLVLPQIAAVKSEDAFVINYLLITDKLDLFGGGLLLALLHYYKDRYRGFFAGAFSRPAQVVMLVLSVLYALSIIRPEGRWFAIFFDHLCAIVLFGHVLLGAVQTHSVLHLEKPLLRTLGRISYGIYLFHTAVCQVVLVLFKKFVGHPESGWLYNLGYPLVNLVVTCTIAYFSYEYFEKFFLKMKNRFAVVKTRF